MAHKLILRAGRPSYGKESSHLSDLGDKEKTVRVNFDLEKEKHKKLKILAAEEERSITDILRELIDKRLGL